MKIIFVPGADGVISMAGQIIAQLLPDGAVVADFEGESLDLAPSTAAVWRDGKIQILANWIGSGPWFDQGADLATRETPIHITELGVDPSQHNWAMTPRPLTKAEVKAAAEAEAKAKADAVAAEKAKAEAAEKARIASISVTDYQLALALLGSGIITQDEAEAYVSVGAIPAIFDKALAEMEAASRAVAKIKIMGAKTILRSDPIVTALGAATGKNAAEIDALFVAAAAL